MKKIQKAVILDFDGTLSDSFWVIQDAFQRLGLEFCDKDTFRDRMQFLKYFGKQKKWKTLWHCFFSPEKIRQTLKMAYEENGKLFQGLEDMLSQLVRRADLKIYILTRNYSQHPLQMIQNLLFRNNVRFFEKIHIKTIHPRKKKNEALREILVEAGLSAEQVLVAGDEYTDYKAFQEEGFAHKLIVTYGFDSLKKLCKKKIPQSILCATPECLKKRVLDFVREKKKNIHESFHFRHGERR